MLDHVKEWHLAGDYRERENDRKYITLVSNEPEEGFRATYEDYWGRQDNVVGIALYDTGVLSFKSIMINALTWGNQPIQNKWGSWVDLQYLDQYDFGAIMSKDYSSLESFEYATFWNGNTSSGHDQMLLIGKDDLAIIWPRECTKDEYHLQITWDVSELIPLQ